MIKLIIFDLDGVLVDTKNIHFEALNFALSKIDKKYIISYDDHIVTYDGLPTLKKLNILNKNIGLPTKNFDEIIKIKKSITKELIKKNIKENKILLKLFDSIKKNYKIAVASNAIKETIILCLSNLKLLDYVDLIISNEEVEYMKPNPQIFLKCMTHFGIAPSETLILEDSAKGRKAAINSSAHLFPVETLLDVNNDNIISHINTINQKNLIYNNEKWSSNNLNVLIPMAGEGSRFKNAGYTFPKPLIEINGKPMIQIVVDNLAIDAHHIFLVRKDHLLKYNLDSVLPLIKKNCTIVPVEQLTEGAACTSLLAEKHINNEKQLIIANSDQFIEWNTLETMYKFTDKNIDGGIITFKSTHPKWSFAKVDKNNFVTEVAEKKPISDNATVGVYFWKKGSEYVNYTKQMISKNIRTNNEFYICPVYNEAIKENKKIKLHQINKMWGLGTPEDLQNFQNYYFKK